MKTIVSAILFLLGGASFAATTIDPANAFAWSGNAGEFNWRPSLADGVLTGEYVCSGKVWAANAGWINLGSGAPANGIRYQNIDGVKRSIIEADDATDFQNHRRQYRSQTPS